MKERIVDEWKGLDRWWTDDPIITYWRIIERDGCSVTQFRAPNNRWTDYSSRPLEQEPPR